MAYYLQGVEITGRSTKIMRSYIGQRVEYLCHADIDKSGRGYIFPREGTINEVASRQISISGTWMMIRDIVEIVIK